MQQKWALFCQLDSCLAGMVGLPNDQPKIKTVNNSSSFLAVSNSWLCLTPGCPSGIRSSNFRGWHKLRKNSAEIKEHWSEKGMWRNQLGWGVSMWINRERILKWGIDIHFMQLSKLIPGPACRKRHFQSYREISLHIRQEKAFPNERYVDLSGTKEIPGCISRFIKKNQAGVHWKWDWKEAPGCNNGLQLPMAWGAPGCQGRAWQPRPIPPPGQEQDMGAPGAAPAPAPSLGTDTAQGPTGL